MGGKRWNDKLKPPEFLALVFVGSRRSKAGNWAGVAGVQPAIGVSLRPSWTLHLHAL